MLLTFVVFWEVELVEVSGHFLRCFFTWLLHKSEQAVKACIIGLYSFSLVLCFECFHTLAQPLSYKVEILTTDLALRHRDFSLDLLHYFFTLTRICRQGTQRAKSPCPNLKRLTPCQQHQRVQHIFYLRSLINTVLKHQVMCYQERYSICALNLYFLAFLRRSILKRTDHT
jgi:hypothetical protein